MRSNCLIETVDGCLWAGTSRGLIQIKNYDRPTPVFNVFFNRPKAPVSFNNECILSVYPDPQHPHILWLGTRGGGLNRFDSKTGSSDFYTQKDGLPDNVVYGILPDDNGRMWLSTNRGLSIFDPSSKRFLTVASDPNAPLNTEFNTCAYQRLPGGELAFGSTQGLFILKPEILQKTGLPGVVAITNIKINGIEIDPTATDSRISRSPLNIIKLDLPHSENNLQLEFAALQTNNPTSVQYRYRLTGLHKKNWIDIARQRSINLAAIPPGAYVLDLQCSVPGLGWDAAPSTSLMLTIHPPWYRSPWSYLVYGLLSVALLYFSLGYYRRRLQLQHAVALGEKEMERLKSLDDFKTRFFSYIAHEFKTPLTLILGMARRLDKNANTTQQNDYAGKIVEQGQNMLELVNQILDISKLNHQEIQLNMQLGNISAYMHYLVESLRPLAEFQKIRLLFETSAPKLLLDFDPARLKYIAHNLIGNAIRHTPEGGTIRVAIHSDTAEQVQLSVSDTGRGIHPKDLPHIFDRYYQGKTGRQEQYHFGLGLAFVKDMVHLLGGAIEVNSALEAGTTFTITFPVSQTASKMEQPLPENNAKANSTKQPNKTKYKQPGLPSLLVVEDNPAISEYIDLCLEPYFQLTFTNNGEQGLEYALENIPDLILTDVMMPGMDGHELTRQLKSHVLTCHIPIVLLSAKSEIADRLAGQSLGANAYVAKPFDETELVLLLKNLHQLQQEWRKRNAMIAASDDPVGQLEKETEQQTSEAAQITHSFLLNVFAHFEKNYTDDTYDLPQLCKDLNMSKSQLQRKLAAVSNQSAMVLLRQFRLQKAYHLLENNPHYNVKEICFEVGFKDPAHFSRSFSKMFQRTPSSFKS
ncbi:MAG: response regulator [Lewinellaceae bacterium]|nr:response regulator [Lewinellaceae bacterium]